jgi:hypothetical protein
VGDGDLSRHNILLGFLQSSQQSVDFFVEQLPGVRSTASWTEAVIAQDISFGSASVRIALEVELLLYFRIVPR